MVRIARWLQPGSLLIWNVRVLLNFLLYLSEILITTDPLPESLDLLVVWGNFRSILGHESHSVLLGSILSLGFVCEVFALSALNRSSLAWDDAEPCSICIRNIFRALINDLKVVTWHYLAWRCSEGKLKVLSDFPHQLQLVEVHHWVEIFRENLGVFLLLGMVIGTLQQPLVLVVRDLDVSVDDLGDSLFLQSSAFPRLLGHALIVLLEVDLLRLGFSRRIFWNFTLLFLFFNQSDFLPREVPVLTNAHALDQFVKLRASRRKFTLWLLHSRLLLRVGAPHQLKFDHWWLLGGLAWVGGLLLNVDLIRNLDARLLCKSLALFWMAWARGGLILDFELEQVLVGEGWAWL